MQKPSQEAMFYSVYEWNWKLYTRDIYVLIWTTQDREMDFLEKYLCVGLVKITKNN